MGLVSEPQLRAIERRERAVGGADFAVGGRHARLMRF
jgi:hypothetical protein